MNFLEIIAYNLLVLNLIFFVLQLFKKNPSVLVKITGLVAVIVFFNELKIIHGVNLVAFLNGSFSDISLTTTIILSVLFIQAMLARKFVDDMVLNSKIMLIVLVMGILLYASVMGVIPLDIYDLGYNPYLSMLLFFILAMLCLVISPLFAFIWAIAFLGFHLKIQNSSNLWDYLLDPFLWFLFLYKLITKSWKIKKYCVGKC